MAPIACLAHNPYPGLRSFQPDEADVFFGRERQIDDLLHRLDEVPLVAVAGASGCGKSSLVLAGLLKALQRRYADGDPVQWRAVVMRPGSDPITHLARPLAEALSAEADPGRAQALAGRLRLGGAALAEAVRTARLPEHVRVLVVVDQFEEIFRYRRISDPEECAAFVKLLLQAAPDTDAPLRVVLTMRSDMLGFCADFRDLPEAVSRGQFLVPRMTREQRKQAIIGPAQLLGCSVAPRLVQRLLNDVSDDFDDLPVMQHVLARTWQRWAEETHGSRAIDIEDYEAVGTSKHALSNHADEAFDSLSGPPAMVERVFRALTERVGGPGSEVRRPLRFSDLCLVTGADAAQVGAVVERYRRADTVFLLPSDVPLAADPPIDISHESLIRGWGRLMTWVDAEAESARMYRRIADAASLYERGKEGLLGELALQSALEWRERERPNAAWAALYANGFRAAMAFVDESERHRRAQRLAERRARKQRRWLRIGVALAILAIIGSGGWQYYLSRGIEQQQQREAQRTMSRRLAHAADKTLQEGRTTTALLLAAAAMRLDYATEEAQDSMRRALRQAPNRPDYRARARDDTYAASELQGAYDVAFDPKTAALAIAAGRASAWIWKFDSEPRDARQLNGKSGGALTSVAYSRDGGLLFAGTHEGWILVWDTRTGELRARWLQESGDRISTVAVADETGMLATGTRDGKVALWNLRACKASPSNCRPEITRELPEPPQPPQPPKRTRHVFSVAFSADGKLLAIASDDGRLRLLNVDDRKLSEAPIVSGAALKKVAFDPAGGYRLAVGGLDRTIRLWDAGDPLSRPAELLQPRGVTALAFSPSGKRLASGGNDGTLRLWDVEGRRQIGQAVEAHENAVFAVAVRGDELTVASVGDDARVAIWDMDLEHWADRACQLAGRDLLDDEWPATLQSSPSDRRPACAQGLPGSKTIAVREGNDR